MRDMASHDSELRVKLASIAKLARMVIYVLEKAGIKVCCEPTNSYAFNFAHSLKFYGHKNVVEGEATNLKGTENIGMYSVANLYKCSG